MLRHSISRRRVLRRGIGTVGAGAIGTASFAGTVAAHCRPRTKGFWANVALDDWPDTERIEQLFTETGSFAGETRSMAAWQEFLTEPARGDTGVIVAQQLVATILNFQFIAGGDASCVREPVDAIDREEAAVGQEAWLPDEFDTVVDVKRAADEWLQRSAFPDPQSSWVVDGVDGEALKDWLDAFNNGDLPIDCPHEDCRLDDSGRRRDERRGGDEGQGRDGDGHGRDGEGRGSGEDDGGGNGREGGNRRD